MIYCISDPHGCYRKYRQMMETISFSENDTLYVLGDCVDRGAYGIEILTDIAKRPNVKLLMGNHEFLAASLLQWIGHPLPEKISRKDIDREFISWFSDNGGHPTYQGYKKLSPENRAIVLDLIRSAPFKTRIEVGGQKFHLSHTLPEYDHFANCTSLDFITGEPDYDMVYDSETVFITGHTPTGMIDAKSVGRIYRSNHHIAIDCGAVFGNPLGCICLDTLQEYYVN